VKDSVLLLASSESIDILHVFDYWSKDEQSKSNQVKLESNPKKIINLEGRKVLILYKTHKKLHFILTNAKK
jgi:hypothetical protein